VSRVRSRQTQRERSDATVDDLVRAARALFAEDGYAATSLEAICDRAGVSKGALYHHFSSKRDVFRVVYEREQEHLSEVVRGAAAKEAERPWEAVFEGCRAFLEASLDPQVQRITQLDAPGALGWEGMRELSGNCLELTRLGVARAVESGAIPARPVDPLTFLLYGALGESALAIARAKDQPAALAETVAELRTLFDALARG
jgi:AcrR family transcriptional regulator